MRSAVLNGYKNIDKHIVSHSRKIVEHARTHTRTKAVMRMHITHITGSAVV